MSRKFRLSFSIILIFSSLQLTTPHVANAAANKCSNIGETKVINKILNICTKIGTKKVWQKTTTNKKQGNVAIRISQYPNEIALIPDLNPTNAPIGLDSPVAESARVDLKDMMVEKSTGAPNIEWIIDPNEDPEKLEQYKKEVVYSVQLLASQRSPKLPLRVYVGMSTNFQWIYDNLTKDLNERAKEGGWLEFKLDLSKKMGSSFNGGAAPGYAKDGTQVLFYNAGNGSHYDSNHIQISMHEYSHVVQREVLKGNIGHMTCWMREGQATYLGFSVSTRYSTAAYRNAWLQMLEYAHTWPTLDGWQSKSANDWTNWYIANEKKNPGQCDPFDNYLLGAIAWEYIYGTYGHKAVESFISDLESAWKNVCPTPFETDGSTCRGWKNAYLKNFGVSPESDYPNFGRRAYEKLTWVQKQSPLYEDKAKVLAPKTWSIKLPY
jgi:hypothetical protein